MQYVILGLLLIQPSTIYNLNKSFEQGISLFYSASLGSIQTTIRILLQKEWITFNEQIENGRNKKIYSITENGQAAFFEWMKGPIPFNKLEVTMLSKIYFMGLVESKEERRLILTHMIDCAEIVENQLTNTEVELGKLEIPESVQMIFHYNCMTLDYGIQTHRFAIEWLKKQLADL